VLRSSAALLIVLAIGTRSAADQDRHAADARSLDELQKRVDAAIMAGDMDTYSALLTADAVLMPPSGPAVEGRDAILAWSRAFAKSFSFEAYQPADAELVIAGDWAFRRASFRVTLAPLAGGPKVIDSGKFIILYKRDGGKWKVARDIWNSDGPPNNEMQRTRPAQAIEPRR
jgi:ketosteroid isomerase-like protein